MNATAARSASIPPGADTRLPLAVIGGGGWGKNLIRNFATLPGVELRYVCDRSSAVRQTVARQYPTTLCLADAEEVLRDTKLRGVVVATDAPNHFELAKAALLAGKDVFVEKPLTLSRETSRELCEIAESKNAILMVGHLLVYHTAVDRLREWIVAGELGEVLYVYSQRLNLGVVRKEENAWWSLAPHDVSVAQYLLGEDAIAVTATGATFLQKDRGIHDVVFATLEFPGGRLAHVHVSWLDPHKTRRLTVVGSKKMAVFDDGSADQKLMLFDKGAEPPPKAVSFADGVRVRTGDIVFPALRNLEPLQRECEAFIEAIHSRNAPLASGRAGLAVVSVLEAGARSLAANGQRTVIS